VPENQPDVVVGDRAPGFRLRHTFDRSVDLADTLQRGPVLLAFYVFDFGGY
jgi:peroxiredoxin